MIGAKLSRLMVVGCPHCRWSLITMRDFAEMAYYIHQDACHATGRMTVRERVRARAALRRTHAVMAKLQRAKVALAARGLPRRVEA